MSEPFWSFFQLKFCIIIDGNIDDRSVYSRLKSNIVTFVAFESILDLSKETGFL